MILLHFCLEFGSFWGLFDNNIDLKMSFLKEIGISVVFIIRKSEKITKIEILKKKRHLTIFRDFYIKVKIILLMNFRSRKIRENHQVFADFLRELTRCKWLHRCRIDDPFVHFLNDFFMCLSELQN